MQLIDNKNFLKLANKGIEKKEGYKLLLGGVS